MTLKYVWQQSDDSSGYTEDNGRSAECLRYFTEDRPSGCTVYENKPGCSTAKSTKVGGRRQCTTQCWKLLLARWTVTDCIGTVKAVLNWAWTRCSWAALSVGNIQARGLVLRCFRSWQRMCSRPMGTHSDVRNVPSAGYESMLLIG